MSSKSTTILDGEAGWSIYDVAKDQVHSGADASVWIINDDGEWSTSLYVYSDVGNDTYEFTACETPLREGLWRAINSFSSGSQGEESGQRLLEPPAGDGLAQLREILERAISYIDAIRLDIANSAREASD